MAAGGYVTTNIRRAISIIIGAVLGGALTALALAVSLIRGSWELDAEGIAIIAVSNFALSAVAWLLVISLLAFPIWSLLERRRSPSWSMAALYGASFTFVLSLVVLGGLSLILGSTNGYAFSPVRMFVGATGFAILGCVIALVMWRVAYRRERAPDLAGAFE